MARKPLKQFHFATVPAGTTGPLSGHTVTAAKNAKDAEGRLEASGCEVFKAFDTKEELDTFIAGQATGEAKAIPDVPNPTGQQPPAV